MHTTRSEVPTAEEELACENIASSSSGSDSDSESDIQTESVEAEVRELMKGQR